ncbi:MAG: glycoside hydrolase family 130 protein [Ignavibacteriaceae bacterium]
MRVQRIKKIFKANPNKVVLQYFDVGRTDRIKNIICSINLLSENEVQEKLATFRKYFEERHQFFDEILFDNYSRIEKFNYDTKDLTEDKKLFIGAYFSKEYSIEAASLFNPSIVPHPDQSLLKPGLLRFILSLRATGEGHISSIEFKSGTINQNNEVQFDSESRFSTLPKKDDNRKFTKKFLADNMQSNNEEFIRKFPETFTIAEAKHLLDSMGADEASIYSGSIQQVLDLLDSNYKIEFPENTSISERVIFPNSNSESHGMEDVRFVKFTEENGSSKYFGTYTAYNGHSFRTQLIETFDFKEFEIRTLHGQGIQDKGMALFPRKINGKYVMTSRQGGENLQIMYSDNLFKWEKYDLLQSPEEPWQYIQMGNCGSPIETEKGWLLITHAVGAFRRYTLGAMLLDLDNPSKILGSLKKPLLEPNEEEREGYVPNVLYSCGSLVHNGDLIIPYAMSDSSTGFAKVELTELLDELTNAI